MNNIRNKIGGHIVPSGKGKVIDLARRLRRAQQIAKIGYWEISLRDEYHFISDEIQLQSMYSDLSPLNNKLQQSTTRIKSIALVHELLYQSAHLTSINLKDYLNKVVPTLQATYAPVGVAINIEIIADEHEININQAVPVGLILNELITNSFQYAFSQKTNGSISILLKVLNNDVMMSYKDDGIGIEDEQIFKQSQSLGFTLIKSQLDQLDAAYQVSTQHGFQITFSFKETDRGSHSTV